MQLDEWLHCIISRGRLQSRYDFEILFYKGSSYYVRVIVKLLSDFRHLGIRNKSHFTYSSIKLSALFAKVFGWRTSFFTKKSFCMKSQLLRSSRGSKYHQRICLVVRKFAEIPPRRFRFASGCLHVMYLRARIIVYIWYSVDVLGIIEISSLCTCNWWDEFVEFPSSK